jgi:hypothetical protein
MNGKLRNAEGSDVVSNVNLYRTGQLMEEVLRADKMHSFLKPGKRIVLAERNHQYLEEILDKLTSVFCPRNIVTYEEHNLPHYIVKDGQIKAYHNLDEHSPVAQLLGRVKHPDSLVEKILRKNVQYGRVCERNNLTKLMINDCYGAMINTKYKSQIGEVVETLLKIPFLKLEHYQSHRKGNGYSAEHINAKYNNGNPAMRGIEIEIQVTDIKSYQNSITMPEQGHDTSYGQEKLASDHNLDGQIVVVGNHISLPDRCRTRHCDGFTIAEVPNSMHPYILVVPRE